MTKLFVFPILSLILIIITVCIRILPTYSMAFVTDCDQTIVFYENPSIDSITNKNEETNQEFFLPLPLSSSGLQGYVKKKNIDLLASIAKHTTIVCASGMRVNTMMNRASIFPHISYWICENGGRIFQQRQPQEIQEIQGSSPFLTEIKEWIEYSRDSNDKAELDRLAEELRQEGWKIDTDGYESMIRVKGNQTLDRLLDRIPSTLKYTRNLGHLDIILPKCGKREAIQWLLSHRINLEDDRYFFMGDDDNDVTAADSAWKAYIINPCSEKMKQWMNDVLASSSHHSSKIIQSPNHLVFHDSTTYLLERALEDIKRIQDVLPEHKT